jgi:hypothetical protein
VLISVFAATAPAVDKGPWWFGGTIGIGGILLGLLIKWAVDAVHTRSRDRRDDKLRFIQDKRVAYADLLAACTEVADAEHDYRLLLARARRLDDSGPWDDEDIAEYNSDRERLMAGRRDAYLAVNRSASIVEMIAPELVVSTANLLAARCHHPHLYQPRVDAELAYVDAVRSDLGFAPTGHLPYVVYEKYIEYDSPDSGVEESEWKADPATK